MPSASREILVTGHPRSGTGYSAKLLQSYGLSVGHERMGDDGVSAWGLAAVSTHRATLDGSNRIDFAFRRVLHVVRHPLKVIASTAHTELRGTGSLEYMNRFIVVGRTAGIWEQACRTYLGWNKLIDAQRPDLRYRVEEAPAVVRRYLESQGLYRAAGTPALPATDYNRRTHPPLTADELRLSIPGSLWLDLVEYAEWLGYGDFDRA